MPRHSIKTLRACVQCGSSYRPRWAEQKFCKQACYDLHRRATHYSCIRCGTVYKAYDRARKFCSHECATAHNQLSLKDKFWAKVNKNGPAPAHCPELGPCWLWASQLGYSGYGQLRVGGRKQPTTLMAHRLAWELVNGPIPPGLLALHKCDRRDCVRADHLFLGTHADNMADMKAKGRARGTSRPGSKHTAAKLTESQVQTIVARHAAGAMQSVLADEYGVSRSLVNMLINRKRWQHV